jgi:orotidine-5'-phosphate decarboxylase
MELAALRAWVPSDVVLVTPGVRLPGDAKGDQKRVMTPQDAHQQGANFIVMGRSVYGSTDPLGTVEEILVALQA